VIIVPLIKGVDNECFGVLFSGRKFQKKNGFPKNGRISMFEALKISCSVFGIGLSYIRNQIE
jgi:hypothetical protein